MRIGTHQIQDLANIVRLEYLPRLKGDIANMAKDSVMTPMLQQRYDEVERLVTQVLEADEITC